MTTDLPLPERSAADEAAEWLPDGLVAVTAPGLIESVNAVALRITGLTREQVVGAPLEVGLPLRDHEGRAWWEVASPFNGLNTRTGHREKLLYLPSGREVLTTARYVRDGRRGPVVVVLIGLRDGEGRRRAERANAALISTIAHELRSPLTGVKGFSATLLRRWDRFTDEQKRFMIDTIEADADRVTRLITELLDVSRIDARRLTIHARPVDLRVVLGRAVERLVASGGQCTVTTNVGAPEVWADPDRLEQMLSNLLDNAVRHARAHIHLSSRPGPDGTVDICVDDDGPGVPVEQRELVFGKFFHGRSPGSTGLGLYIVRGLAEAQGGSVVLEEAPDGGARVRISLPAGQED